MADYFDDEEDANPWAQDGLIDVGVERELEAAIFDSFHEYIVVAIDCHPANILRRVLVENPYEDSSQQSPQNSNDPNQGKLVISQLEQVIQSVISSFRNSIMITPERKFAVLLYNLPVDTNNPQGMKFMLHSGNRKMHTLSKRFILDMIAIQHKEDFIDKLGICPWMEGSTPFSQVIGEIVNLFKSELPAGVPMSKLKRHVWLFTPFPNPCQVPFQVFSRRVNNDQNAQAKLRHITHDMASVKQDCFSDEVAVKRALENNSDIQFDLFPLFSALPDLFEPIDDEYGFSFYNSLPGHMDIIDKFTPSQRQSYDNSQRAVSQFDRLSQSQVDQDSASVLSGATGSLRQRVAQQHNQQHPASQNSLQQSTGPSNQFVSLSDNTSMSSYLGSDRRVLQILATQRRAYTPEPLIQGLKLFLEDRSWLKKALVSSIGGASKFVESREAAIKRETGGVGRNNNNDGGDDEDDNDALRNLNNDPVFALQKHLAELQTSLGPSKCREKNKKTTKLSFSPDFFSQIFPLADIPAMIREHRSKLVELATDGGAKFMRKRALVTLPFFFPKQPWEPERATIANSCFFGLDIFPQFIETKVTQSNDVKLEPINKSIIKSTTNQLGSSGEVLTKDDTTNYVPVGGKEVLFFTKEDVAQVKQFGPGSLRLIGFQQYDGTMQDLIQKCLRPNENLQRPYFCRPNDEKYPGSSQLCGDLIQVLYLTHRVIVAQFIPKLGAIPRIVYLLPTLETLSKPGDVAIGEDVEEQRNQHTGFQLIFAPFYEDVREPPTTTASSLELPDAISDALHDVIDQYQLRGIPDGRGKMVLEPNCVFDLGDCPSLQKLRVRNRILEHKALGTTLIMPSDELKLDQSMSHIDEIVEGLYAVIQETYPGLGQPKEKMARGKKKVTGDGDDVKAEPKPRAPTKRGAAKQQVDDFEGKGEVDLDEESAKPKRGGAAAASKRAAAVKKEQAGDDDTVKPKTTRGRKPAVIKTEMKDEDDHDNDDDMMDLKPKKKLSARLTKVEKFSDEEDNKPVRKAPTRGKKVIVESDQEEEEEEQVKPTRKASMRTATTRKKPIVDSTDDDDHEEEEEVIKPVRKAAARGKKKKDDTESDYNVGSDSDVDIKKNSTRSTRSRK